MKRRQVPLAVQLEVALRQLGMTRAEVELNHNPPLGLREFDAKTGKYTPDEHDPAFLEFMPKAEHRARTNGAPHFKANGDSHKVAKARRLNAAHEEFKAKLLRPKSKAKPARSKWPSRKFNRKVRRTGWMPLPLPPEGETS